MERSRRELLLGIVLLLAAPAWTSASEPPIALLGALDAEVQPLLAALTDRETVSVLGISCALGKIEGRPAVVAATGVGKVNAAMTTALIVERFSPRAVIFTGVAGALASELQPGDVVIGETYVQHDLVNHTAQGAVPRSVRNPRDGVEIPIRLQASPSLLALARRAAPGLVLERVETEPQARAPRVSLGTIVTGDSFIGAAEKKSALRDDFDAAAVEMEGAAVAQVAYELGVPFLVVRGLSDRAGGMARAEAQRNLGGAARNSAATALAIARLLGAEPAAAR